MMWLGKMAMAVSGTVYGDDLSVSGVTIDSRSDCSDLLFIAIRGDRFDGHDFVASAVEAGATAVMVEDRDCLTGLPAHISIIEVEDCHQALSSLASWWRRQFAIPVLGVTGSAGKTTVKEMLNCIFSEIGSGLATKGNLNNDIGVPLTLLRLTEQDQFAVVEMGMSALGEIEHLTNLVRPNIAVITNAAAAHLEGVGSIDNVAQAKGEIFSGLQLDGVAVINQDDEFSAYWLSLNSRRKVVTFGEHELADVQGKFSVSANSCEIQVATKDEKFVIHLPVPGKHMASNALAATTVALAANVPSSAIIEGLSKFRNVAGRMQLQTVNDVLLIDDSYNANPASMRSAIEVLVRQPGPHNLVLGDMGELGDVAEAAHRELGAFARNHGVDNLYAVGDLSRFTAQEFGDSAYFYDTRDELLDALSTIEWQGSYLFKGSRFMAMEKACAHAVEQVKRQSLEKKVC